jgi:hypothetical protein
MPTNQTYAEQSFDDQISLDTMEPLLSSINPILHFQSSNLFEVTQISGY